MRIAGGPKCASDPHVVCALRYGSKSGRRAAVQPDAGDYSPLRGAAAEHGPQPDPLPRTEPGIVPGRTTAGNRSGDPREALRRPEGSSFGGTQPNTAQPLREALTMRCGLPPIVGPSMRTRGSSGHGSQVCSLAVIVSTCQPLSVSVKCISYRTPPHPYSGCMYPIPTETL